MAKKIARYCSIVIPVLVTSAAFAAERTAPPFGYAVPAQGVPGSPEGLPGLRPDPSRKHLDPRDVDPKSMPIPDKPSEREKLLQNLYAYLATAGSKDEAEPIAATIERLWMLRGTDTAFYLMERSRVAIQQGDTAGALAFLDQVVDLAPDYAEGWLRRAYVHVLTGDKERALGDLRRCLALEPSHFQALRATGMIFLDNEQNSAALKAFEKLLEIHPQDSDASKIIEDLRLKVEGQKT